MTALPQAALPLRPRRAKKVLYGRKQRQAHNSAFGNELPGSFDGVPGGMAYKFVGGLGCRTDLATSLVYMRQRWYDSQLGTFLSRDPIGLRGSINLYGYVGQDPVNSVDPTGLAVRMTYYEMEYKSFQGFGAYFKVRRDETFTDGEAFLKAIQRAVNIDEIDFLSSGHGNCDCQAIEGDDLSSDVLKREVHPLGGNEVYLRVRGKYYNVKELGFVEKGLKRITLGGCNTAGGHRDPVVKARSLAELRRHYNWPKNKPLPRSWTPEPGDDNLAHDLKAVLGPSVDVVGHAGIHWSSENSPRNEPPVHY